MKPIISTSQTLLHITTYQFRFLFLSICIALISRINFHTGVTDESLLETFARSSCTLDISHCPTDPEPVAPPKPPCTPSDNEFSRRSFMGAAQAAAKQQEAEDNMPPPPTNLMWTLSIGEDIMVLRQKVQVGEEFDVANFWGSA